MADIDSALRQWSATASSNKPTGATSIGSGLDDNLRQLQATVRQYLASPGSTIASSSTVDLSTADGRTIPISGSSTVTGLGTEVAGIEYILTTLGTQVWKNSSSLLLPGAADITSASGDYMLAQSKGSGNWVIPWFTKAALGTSPPFLDSTGVVKNSSIPSAIVRISAAGVSSATTRVLTAQDRDGTVSLTDEFAYAGVPGASGRLVLPNHYISGFTLTTASTTTYDIAAGQATDSTNVSNIIGSAITAKSQSAWAAGSSAGGKLSAAAMANNTWYYWFALWKTADGTVDYGFDVATTPTLPSGYSKYRYIGARKTQSASTNWDTFIQHGDQVNWGTPSADVNVTNAGTAAVLRTLNVPAVKVEALVNVGVTSGASTFALYLSDPAVTDVAASAGVNSTFQVQGVSNLNLAAQARVWTNASSQIRTRQSASGADSVQNITTTGWIDPRGKPV